MPSTLDTPPRVSCIIRPADEGDLNAIVAMGGRFLASSEYQGKIADVPEQRAALTMGILQSPDAVILVAESVDEMELVGFLGLHLYRHPMSGQRFCTEVAWWVEPHARGRVGIQLLREGEAWARLRGAEVLQMIAPSPEVERLYERKGYLAVERNYQKAL